MNLKNLKDVSLVSLLSLLPFDKSMNILVNLYKELKDEEMRKIAENNKELDKVHSDFLELYNQVSKLNTEAEFNEPKKTDKKSKK